MNKILFDLGNDVSGYDDAQAYKFTQKGLEERGIEIFYDHEHPIDSDTIVTYSVAFSEDHPELVRVRNLGIKVKKYLDSGTVSMMKTLDQVNLLKQPKNTVVLVSTLN